MSLLVERAGFGGLIGYDDLPDWAGLGLSSPDDNSITPVAPEELAGLSENAAERRKRSFRMGRAAARAALRAANLPSPSLGIGHGGQPRWPGGTIGSISHCDEAAIAVVAPTSKTDGIGVDIERVRTVPEIVELVTRPEEMAWLQQSEDPDSDLLRLFSAKECVFKAFFPRVGRWFGFEAASLRPAEGGFEGRLLQRLDPDYPPDRTFFVRNQVSDTHLLSWLVLPKTVA